MSHRQGTLSKWWPISFFIATVIFFIIGGGLFGGYAATPAGRHGYTNLHGFNRVSGLFYGGCACIAIGGVCKLTGWILLIVYCIKRNRGRANNGYPVPPVAYPQTAYVPQTSYQQQYAPISNPTTPAPEGIRCCHSCGSPVTAAFCTKCGTKT